MSALTHLLGVLLQRVTNGAASMGLGDVRSAEAVKEGL